jgi:protein KRI1
MDEAEPLTNVQSERLLRQEALDAFKSFGADESEGEEEDGFLQKRVKTENELKEEEAAYRQFLLESGGGEDEVRRVLGFQPKTSTDDVAASDDASDSDDGEVIDGQEGSAPTAPASMSAEKRTKKPKQSDDDFLMK